MTTPTEQTAAAFTAAILAERSDAQREQYRRYFPATLGELGVGDHFTGVRMGAVFGLAKRYLDLPSAELESMLDNGVHEVRVGALKAMSLDAARSGTTAARREELFELYLRRHDRVNDWDLVDLAAANVVGVWLLDGPAQGHHALLRELAAHDDRWRRRTSIVATAAFISRRQLDATFEISEALVRDGEELVQKAVAWMLRYAGDRDRARLLDFLDTHAASMPRPMLRGAIEKLDAARRADYLERRGE